ncbi:hypothetical protein E2562_002883 [Oryza meyeriana var. granulata]|uniref:Uncharacterized protein n=1 Tax=Oryza meyeriana var. granulata TaxID=110450 RepID=A0A6G1DCR2_9ORYZ|nr:hypothetical protein E2562_002883 [Oryza meyeriana var. granulata]
MAELSGVWQGHHRRRTQTAAPAGRAAALALLAQVGRQAILGALFEYYVTVVSGKDVVLLLGDLKKEAFRRTGSRPSLQDAVLVCKEEHVFRKKRFLTKASSSNLTGGMDVNMVIKIDWKFKGNKCI